MANQTIFKSATSVNVARPINVINEAGGVAYKMEDKHALAQLICTGCFNNTFYVDAQDQVNQIIKLCQNLESDFIAKCAIYARSKGYMKDSPALLLAILSTRDYAQFENVFKSVIDNGKMLRNFVQIIRSGIVGRKSFGSRLKRAICKWLDNRTDKELLNDSVGNSPSLCDIIKMVHPKPKNKTRSALYAYLINKSVDIDDLPSIVRSYEVFKNTPEFGRKNLEVPDVSFQMLSNLNLNKEQWADIAKRGSWHMVRMNLNTFQRHGVFSINGMETDIAEKLRNESIIRKSKVFPYQLLTTFNNVESSMPTKVKNALQDAVEISINNIPELDGKIYVFVDTSGSMSSAITGNRGSVTSVTRCIDVASLIAASIARKNEDTTVLAFDTNVHKASFNSRDSVLTNAQKFSQYGGGRTNCSAPMRMLNEHKAKGDVIIYVSDNESWVDRGYRYSQGTGTSQEWDIFKKRNPKAKLICIDLTPNTSIQVQERKDVLNIGGFSDNVFEVISQFIDCGSDKNRWVQTIEKVLI